MELTPLRYFIAIARAGHMTRAARSLGVSQPALSAMLRKLEQQTGAELLHRTGRGVLLTEAGTLLLHHAEECVRRADEGLRAVRELAGLERGSIRVGGGATAITYLLPRIISEFRRAHPGLRFYVREAGSKGIAAAVLGDALDLGLVTLPLSHHDSSELLVRPLVHDELRLIVPEQHPLRSRRSFRWSDLKSESVVAFEAGTAVRAVIDQASAGAGVPLSVVMELRSIESIKHMVAAGIGVGFVSRFALRDGEGLACKDGRLSREIAIIRRQGRMPSRAAAEFERLLHTSQKND